MYHRSPLPLVRLAGLISTASYAAKQEGAAGWAVFSGARRRSNTSRRPFCPACSLPRCEHERARHVGGVGDRRGLPRLFPPVAPDQYQRPVGRTAALVLSAGTASASRRLALRVLM